MRSNKGTLLRLCDYDADVGSNPARPSPPISKNACPCKTSAIIPHNALVIRSGHHNARKSIKNMTTTMPTYPLA